MHNAALVTLGSKQSCGSVAGAPVWSPWASVAPGPEPPSVGSAGAALRLPETGHSSILQHFRRVKVGKADNISFRYRPDNRASDNRHTMWQ